MSVTQKDVFKMRQKVVESLFSNPSEFKSNKFISLVMTTLISLACDIHRKTGGNIDELLLFASSVWGLLSEPEQLKNKIIN